MKRTLALLLAAVMIFALLPATVSAEQTEERAVYSYNFQPKALHRTSSYIRWFYTTGEVLSSATFDDVDESYTAPWIIYGDRCVNSGRMQNGENYWNYYAGKGDNYSNVVFKIRVAEGGTFLPTVNYSSWNGCAGLRFFISKVTDEDTALAGASSTAGTAIHARVLAMTEDECLGEVDMYSDSEIHTSKSADLKAVTLSAGEYLLIFSTTAGNNENAVMIRDELLEQSIKSFVLTEISPDEFTASADDEAISIGGTTTVRASASVGKTPISGASFTYESEDESIAKVNSDGVVTGVSQGSTNISARLEHTDIYKTIPITVNAVKSEKYDSFVFSAQSHGKTSTVRMNEVSFNFANTDTSVSSKWQYFGYRSMYSGNFDASGFAWWDTAVANAVFPNHAVSFKINVEKAGEYIPSLSYVAMPSAFINNVYLVPASASVSGGFDTSANLKTFLQNGSGYKIGTVDMYAGAATEKEAAFAPVTLSAGEYYLVFAANGTNPAFSPLVASQNSYAEAKIRAFTLDCPDIVSYTASPAKTKIPVGESVQVNAGIYCGNGKSYDVSGLVSCTVKKPSVASFSGNELRGVSAGETKVTASFELDGKTQSCEFNVTVISQTYSDFKATAGGSEHIRISGIPGDTVPLYVTALDSKGKEVDSTYGIISAQALTPEIATVDGDNMITPVSEGEAQFNVTFTLGGKTLTKTVSLTAARAKTESTYMTAEKAANARENAAKYSWAASTVSSAKNLADYFVPYTDRLYDYIISQEVPRSMTVGGENDPEMFTCRYCGKDLAPVYGTYPWLHDPFVRPWKIQCPECKRYFPSNDFGSFYELGLNEYGEFKIDLARARNAELVADGEDGYLKNVLYPEAEEKFGDANWGVDDGYGYETGRRYPNGTNEHHTYIAEYMHYGIFESKSGDNGGILERAVQRCATAYFYTGEEKYGRVAAIALDRLADFYPDYDISAFGDNVWNSDGGSNKGKCLGCIWETGNASTMMAAYDEVFDMYDDPYVLNYIKEKSKTIKFRHAKNTPSQLRTNVEDGLIRTALDGLIDCSVSGNFGYPQKTNAVGAVVLDSMPETAQWLDYLMAPGWKRSGTCLGGGIDEVLVDTIDADGFGDEASSYNVAWLTSLMSIQEVLNGYDKYTKANFYNNPKYAQMFYAFMPMIASYYTPQIGDTASTCSTGHWMSAEIAKTAFRDLHDPIFAQYLYMQNNNSSANLRYDITVKNPERLTDEVQNAVDTYGAFTLKSDIETGFGFSILSRGTNVLDNKDTRRNVWMYFGSNSGHGHKDTLELGMTAFGLNIMPDLGYPVTTGTDPNRLQWVGATLSHNTATVNEIEQTANTEVRGKVLHYDTGEKAQVIDVDASYVYPAASTYRRSVVMVEAGDDNSYYVDFFRILGGNTHLLSTHFSATNITTEGLNLVPQKENGEYVGSYAGADVPFGKDPNSPASWSYTTKYPRGYTWLDCVDRDSAPQNKFSVDFEIEDFRNVIADNENIHLNMTVLEQGNAEKGMTSDVSTAYGYAPQKSANAAIGPLKYLLIRHKGTNLNTVFTSVYEPYKGEHFLSDISEMSLARVSGSESASDVSRAVKVVHENGRCDYIFYATNNNVTYKLSDNGCEIFFRGFAGVYTLEEGRNTYRYVCDGDIIGGETGKTARVTGSVKTFTKELSASNEIVITPNAAVSDEDVTSLVGNVVVVDNGATTRDGAYKILSAEKRGSDIALNTGRITQIRQYANSKDPSQGFRYTIADGQSAYIPCGFEDNSDFCKTALVYSDGFVSVSTENEAILYIARYADGAMTDVKIHRLGARTQNELFAFEADQRAFLWDENMMPVREKTVPDPDPLIKSDFFKFFHSGSIEDGGAASKSGY